MLLQFFAHHKRVLQTGDDFLLLGRKFVWVRGIDCRERCVGKWISFPVDLDGHIVIVDMFEKKTVVHIPFRMLFDELSFKLELNN